MKKKQPTKADAIGITNVGYAFGKDVLSSEASHRRFARLSCFRTELYDRTALPSSWRPTLTLGSLLASGKQSDSGGEVDFLLCTQPRCDAVRLDKNGRLFPFQVTTLATDTKFNLVAAIPGARGKPNTVLLNVDSRPHATRMIQFRPEEGEDRIFASQGDGDIFGFVEDNFEFVDVNGYRYVWIGDLRDLTALRMASMVAARLHEVGIDAYERLRLKQ